MNDIRWRAQGILPPTLDPGERSGATPEERNVFGPALRRAIAQSGLTALDGTVGVLPGILRQELGTWLPKEKRRFSVSRPERLIHWAVERGALRWITPKDALEHFALHVSRRGVILRVVDASLIEDRFEDGPWRKPILAYGAAGVKSCAK